MIKITTMLHKFFNKYFSILLGLILVILFIWLRYLRIRLPRDLPFPYLSLIAFVIITFSCIIYILIIKFLVKPGEKKTIFTEYILPKIYIPLESLDKFIKEHLNIEEIIDYLAYKCSRLIINSTRFYLIFAIIPRMILVTVLFTDVFYFHKLHYIYYALYLTILLFLNRYIIYSFKEEKKRLIDKLKYIIEGIDTEYSPGVIPDEDLEDPEYDPFMPSMHLSIEVFIDFQVNSIIHENLKREYSFSLTNYYYDNFYIKYGLMPHDDKIWNIYYKEFRKQDDALIEKKIEKITNLAALIEYYNITHYNNKKFKTIKILVFTIYLLCWSYVLITSIPNLDINYVIYILFKILKGIENPFL